MGRSQNSKLALILIILISTMFEGVNLEKNIQNLDEQTSEVDQANYSNQIRDSDKIKQQIPSFNNPHQQTILKPTEPHLGSNNFNSETSFIQNQHEFHFDQNQETNLNGTIDVYPGNTINVSDDTLVVTGYANTFAHFQTYYEGSHPIIESKQIYVSGSTGASWASGIGIYWDDENSFLMNIEKFSSDTWIIRFSYYLSGIFYVSSQSIIYPIISWMGLKVDLNTTGSISTYYNLNNGTWQDFVPSSGANPSSLILPNTWFEPGLAMVGKGFMNSIYNGGDEFNKYHSTIGSAGTSKIDYFNITTRICKCYGEDDYSNFNENFNSAPSFMEAETYNSNNITYTNGNMLIQANINSFAHLEANFSGIRPIIETRFKISNYTKYSAWGPGLGVWWDGSNSFTYFFDGDGAGNVRIRFYYKMNGVVGDSYYGFFLPSYNWISLRVDLSEVGKIKLYYQIDDFDWLNYNPNWSSGTVPSALNTIELFHKEGLLYLGKGLQTGVGGTIGTDEFNTYSSTDVGEVQEMEFDYFTLSSAYEIYNDIHLINQTLSINNNRYLKGNIILEGNSSLYLNNMNVYFDPIFDSSYNIILFDSSKLSINNTVVNASRLLTVYSYNTSSIVLNKFTSEVTNFQISSKDMEITNSNIGFGSDNVKFNWTINSNLNISKTKLFLTGKYADLQVNVNGKLTINDSEISLESVEGYNTQNFANLTINANSVITSNSSILIKGNDADSVIASHGYDGADAYFNLFVIEDFDLINSIINVIGGNGRDKTSTSVAITNGDGGDATTYLNANVLNLTDSTFYSRAGTRGDYYNVFGLYGIANTTFISQVDFISTNFNYTAYSGIGQDVSFASAENTQNWIVGGMLYLTNGNIIANGSLSIQAVSSILLNTVIIDLSSTFVSSNLFITGGNGGFSNTNITLFTSESYNLDLKSYVNLNFISSNFSWFGGSLEIKGETATTVIASHGSDAADAELYLDVAGDLTFENMQIKISGGNGQDKTATSSGITNGDGGDAITFISANFLNLTDSTFYSRTGTRGDYYNVFGAYGIANTTFISQLCFIGFNFNYTAYSGIGQDVSFASAENTQNWIIGGMLNLTNGNIIANGSLTIQAVSSILLNAVIIDLSSTFVSSNLSILGSDGNFSLTNITLFTSESYNLDLKSYVNLNFVSGNFSWFGGSIEIIGETATTVIASHGSDAADAELYLDVAGNLTFENMQIKISGGNGQDKTATSSGITNGDGGDAITYISANLLNLTDSTFGSIAGTRGDYYNVFGAYGIANTTFISQLSFIGFNFNYTAYSGIGQDVSFASAENTQNWIVGGLLNLTNGNIIANGSLTIQAISSILLNTVIIDLFSTFVSSNLSIIGSDGNFSLTNINLYTSESYNLDLKSYVNLNFVSGNFSWFDGSLEIIGETATTVIANHGSDAADAEFSINVAGNLTFENMQIKISGGNGQDKTTTSSGITNGDGGDAISFMTANLIILNSTHINSTSGDRGNYSNNFGAFGLGNITLYSSSNLIILNSEIISNSYNMFVTNFWTLNGNIDLLNTSLDFNANSYPSSFDVQTIGSGNITLNNLILTDGALYNSYFTTSDYGFIDLSTIQGINTYTLNSKSLIGNWLFEKTISLRLVRSSDLSGIRDFNFTISDAISTYSFISNETGHVTILFYFQVSTQVVIQDFNATYSGNYHNLSFLNSIVISSSTPNTIQFDLTLLDTDGDGMLDEYELNNGLNNSYNDSNEDLDSDNISNYLEFTLGSAANSNDTDSDTIDDFYEYEHNLDIDGNDAFQDLDGDGINNLLEYTIGTSANNTDSDFDGMDDFYEYYNNLNPLLIDTSLDKDLDGLDNLLEYNLGTSANITDTDTDGIDDYYEYYNNLNPLSNDASFDFDTDGLENLLEYTINTSANNTDSDFDGMDDFYEYYNDLNPLVDDTSLDFDNDGLNNIEEYVIGTSANNSDTDFDIMDDFYEYNNQLDPLFDDFSSDFDNDGLMNGLEYFLNSFSNSNDTDMDTMDDYYEYNNNLDLLNNDTFLDEDSDGIYNIIEYIIGSSANSTDSDLDAIPDLYEYQNNLNLLFDDSLLDYDEDNLNNLLEYNLGTSANNTDTDFDLMDDFYEYNNQLDPLIDDSGDDLDIDGLNNGLEYLLGTLANRTDTDFDGIDDYYEYYNNLNPLMDDANLDLDNDGIYNLLEYGLGTSANLSDSDFDGMTDGYEYNHDLNPLIDDSGTDLDDDGLSNIVEYNLGTSANLSDTDMDQMNDYYEYLNDLNPLFDDASLDLDTDGLMNLIEFSLGTAANSTDTDSDGMDDYYEYYNNLNPLSNDSMLDQDADGITNLIEFGLGSSANSTDTDSDLLPDQYELDNGLNLIVDDSSEDLDSDGISNFQEYLINSNPNNKDTDSDGIDDFFEFQNGLNITLNDATDDFDGDGMSNYWEYIFNLDPTLDDSESDFDYDGLTNSQEYLLNSMPNRTDTDLDGMDDSYEFLNNLNLLLDDTLLDADNDSLTNYLEYIINSNPQSNDTDGDGMDDNWEYLNSLNLIVFNSNQDPDLDGMTNIEEYLANTDPNNGDSDSDGIPDLYEWLNDLDPLSIDSGLDEDQDGLTNYLEYIYGTSANATDTDLDSISDGFEVTYGLNPLFDDTGFDLDQDQLTNIEEIGLGTLVNNPDTDGDLIPDGYEVNQGQNPLISDSSLDPDQDNLSNLEEFISGTNPNSNDTDFDGMTDDYEVYYGLNPNSNDSNYDFDNDGLNNVLEYSIGTFPNNNDTDADLMNDGYEWNNGLNPLINDSSTDADGDGLSNYLEYIIGTNVQNNDTDSDGMDDYYEYTFELNPVLKDQNYDNDNDGLTNLEEYLLGLKPNNIDSDGDTIDDGYEVEYGLNFFEDDSQEDYDSDSLSNLEEYEIQTSPIDPDSDDDQIIDGYEVHNNLNPLFNDANQDLDGDGLSNLEEFRLGTYANNVDSDGDQIDDLYEIQYGLNPLFNDAFEDLDGDGLNNLQEYSYGTSPNNADSDNDGMNDKNEIENGFDPNDPKSSEKEERRKQAILIIRVIVFSVIILALIGIIFFVWKRYGKFKSNKQFVKSVSKGFYSQKITNEAQNNGFNNIRQYRDAKKLGIDSKVDYQLYGGIMKNLGFSNYSNFKNSPEYKELLKLRQGGFDTQNEYEIAKEQGYDNKVDFEKSKYFGIPSKSEFDRTIEKIKEGRFPNYETYLMAEKKGIPDCSEFLIYHSNGFAKSRITVPKFYEIRSKGFSHYSNYILAKKYKIEDEATFNDVYENLIEKKYPDYDTYLQFNQKIKNGGFPNYPSFVEADKLGYNNFKEYQDGVKGGFKDFNEFIMASKKGFNHKSEWIEAKEMGFDSFDEWTTCKNLGFHSKSEMDFANNIDITSYKEFEKIYKKLDNLIQTYNIDVSVSLVSIQRKLKIEYEHAILLLQYYLRKNPHAGIYLEIEEAFIKPSKILPQPLNGIISKTSLDLSQDKVKQCPNCYFLDKESVWKEFFRGENQRNLQPLCPACKNQINPEMMRPINSGAVTGRRFTHAGDTYAMCKHCGSIEKAKIYLEFIKTQPCKGCGEMIREKDLIIYET